VVLLGDLVGDGAEAGVDEHLGAVGELVDALRGDDRGQAQLSGEDRGVGLGAAVGGDQRDHPLGIEGRGVGGGEVDRGEHEGLVDLGDAGGLLTAQLGDDAGAHVAHVCGALGHVPAEVLEHRGDLVAGLPDGPVGGLAAGEDEALGGLGQRRVGGHLRGRLEDLLAVAVGALGEAGEGGLHGGGRGGDPLGLGGAVGVVGEDRVRRRLGDRRGHRADRPDHPSGAHCHTCVLRHRRHLLDPAGCSWWRSCYAAGHRRGRAGACGGGDLRVSSRGRERR
jgi:hypothetical protein